MEFPDKHYPRLLAAFFLAACLPGLAQTAYAQMNSAVPVRVAVATVKEIAPETRVPGTVVSRHDANLSAEVSGRLTQVSDVGSVVQEGEPLAIIEDTAIRLRKAELEAEVTRVQARLQFLESEERRFNQLAESNLAAKTQLEQIRSDRDVSRSDLAVARARLEQNADQLMRTRILAPFDGIVVERMMTPGERVDEGSEVVRLVDQQTLEIITRAPLSYFAYVKPGQPLMVSGGGVQAEATVRTVVAVGDEFTHQFEIRLDLEAGIFPVGQTLRVSVPVSHLREALTVPRDALVLRSNSTSIFLLTDENTARKEDVTLGVGQGDNIEVFGNVKAGDRVVIRGNERLQPGQSVTIKDG